MGSSSEGWLEAERMIRKKGTSKKVKSEGIAGMI